MLVTTNWINEYLVNKISADEQAELLTAAGFPLEGREDLPDGDVRQDFEMTSNRGDCTCHLGLAREIAARTGNTLIEPEAMVDDGGPSVEQYAKVDNLEHSLCPLYMARVILGIQVKDSPSWLATRIANRGDIPRNAIVDATNFVLFEIGQPTHVFDLDKLAGNRIEIRRARQGELFLPLGEDATEIKLTTDDLVIADAEKPVALAGVKGGAATAVTSETKNILIEAATFDPVIVREMSRRHKLGSDSSFRFERGVNPRQVEMSANRLASLLLKVGGGKLCKGILRDGQPLPDLITTTMRTAMCRERIGIDIPDDLILEHLRSIGFDAALKDGLITSTVPYVRGDIHREIDLIEEVGRIHGYEKIAIEDSIEVRVPPSGGEAAGRKAVLSSLAGMGFIECVTHSLISIEAAKPFLLDGQLPLVINDDRAAAEPALRPSIIPSLLTVQKHNVDNRVKNLRLMELGSIFSLEGKVHTEITELALVINAGDDEGIGVIRGIVDRVCEVLSASTATTVEPLEHSPWLEPGGSILLGGVTIGRLGRLSKSLQDAWDLPNTLHIAQLHIGDLFHSYPPDIESYPLPNQPAIERDISIIIDESVSWLCIRNALTALELELLEDITFVTTFRSKKIGSNKKSLTLKLRFRDDKRSLTHEEVNGPVAAATKVLVNDFAAEIRS